MPDRKSFLLLLLCLAPGAFAQSRLPLMPGAAEFRQHAGKARGLVTLPTLGRWLDADRFSYSFGGKTQVFSVSKGETVAGVFAPSPTPQARGRQRDQVTGPGGLRAVHEGGNVVLIRGGERIPLTTEGGKNRIKIGTASWVYGEELDQRDAMGFSPDGKFLWMYRFDEGQVQDFYTLLGQGGTQNRLAIEAYPKPGTANPTVDLIVADVATGKLRTVPVRPGAFDDGIGHYVYAITFSSDSRELTFHRMNRRQNVREFCGYDLQTGKVRVIDREETSTGWVDYDPLQDLSGGAEKGKWLISSEVSGFHNLFWLDLAAGKRTPITSHAFDVIRVLTVTPDSIFYLTAGDKNPYLHQVWRSDRNGKNPQRLSDPALTHTAVVSPGGQHVGLLAQNSTNPPKLQIVDRQGKVVKVLAESDISKLKGSPYRPSERIWFPTLDGKTQLSGELHFPANFDPSKRYPVLFSVYGGPLPMSWGVTSETFGLPNDLAHYGFIIAEVDVRGGHARGRAFRQSINESLGITEIDDMAAMAKHLATLGYVDAKKVGIFGTSYGGYAAAMAILRYPDLFQAAAANSIVSDWRQYDTTYTERYMGLLPANQAAYDRASTMTYAKNLRGHLMIYFGTLDDNTHPNNALSLIAALQRERKSFEVQVGPDRGHTAVSTERMMEFFIERLVMAPPVP